MSYILKKIFLKIDFPQKILYVQYIHMYIYIYNFTKKSNYIYINSKNHNQVLII